MPLKSLKNQVSFHEEDTQTKEKIKRMPKSTAYVKQITSDSQKLKIKKGFSQSSDNFTISSIDIKNKDIGENESNSIISEEDSAFEDATPAAKNIRAGGQHKEKLDTFGTLASQPHEPNHVSK